MPWIQDQQCGYIWFGKGKTRIEGRGGYETTHLDAKQYELILYHMRKIDLLKGDGKKDVMYWHFPNNEEVEINPENRSITFKKDSARRSVRDRLESIIGIEYVEVGH